MKDKIISFTSQFGNPEKFNSQFHKVKIYVAYAGKNRNGSFISKDTFEKIIPSLYGVPIVGEWKDEDFGTHGGKVEISDDGVQFIDTTKPYGYIDSSAEVKWELVTEEDGTEREYLTVDGFLWTARYPEALKVLENQNNQSMELNVYDGAFDEDNDYFEITDGEFSALCILGEDVEPCFESSKLSQFNLDKETFKKEFNLMVKELKASLDTQDDVLEGGELEMEKEPKNENFVEEVDTKNAEEVNVDFEVKYNNLLDEHKTLTKENSSLKEQVKTMESELKKLKEFKAQKDQEAYELQLKKEKQEKIDFINTEFTNIPDDVKQEFINKVDEYESIEAIETDICVYIVKNKVNFSKSKAQKQQVKLGVEKKDDTLKSSPYGDLF